MLPERDHHYTSTTSKLSPVSRPYYKPKASTGIKSEQNTQLPPIARPYYKVKASTAISSEHQTQLPPATRPYYKAKRVQESHQNTIPKYHQ